MFLRLALIFLVAGIATSCSEKSTRDREQARKTSEAEASESKEELRPEEDQIAEDCAAFVRATKVVPARAANTECPTCPAAGSDALSFRQVKTDAVSCSGDTCNVVATIRAVFNPGSGETVTGGLTAWIPPEERSAYLRGEMPAGEQSFRVQITYKRRGEVWRAIDFDRASAQ